MDKRGVLYALVSSATFGLITLFTIPLIKSGDLSVISILFYRYGMATLGVGLLALIRGENFRVTKVDIPKILILSVLYSITSLFLLFGYNVAPTDSGIYTAIHYLYPVSVMLTLALIYREKLSYYIISTALIAIVGVGLLTIKGDEALTQSSPLGIIFVLISVITYGIYIVGANKLKLSNKSSIVLTFYLLLIGTVTIGIYGALTEGITPINSSSAIINLALLAIISTVISNLTLILAVKRIGSTVTSILGSLEPLTAIFVALFIFNEQISIAGYFGILLIIISAIMAIKRK